MKLNYILAASILAVSFACTGVAVAQTQQSREVLGVEDVEKAIKAAIEAGKQGKMDDMKAQTDLAHKATRASSKDRASVQMERALPHITSAQAEEAKGNKDGAMTHLEEALKAVGFSGGY
jgi:hypothetical protein